MTNSSGEQFKKGLDKAFSGIKLNGDTMIDLMGAKQGVKEEDDMSEEWSEKYKKSIDCSHPKGFSQRAHCQGRKKKDKSETKEATGSGSSGAFSAPVFGGDDAFWDRSRKETPELKEMGNVAHKKLNEIEAAYEQEDEDMMIRLIKVRQGLWT